MLAVEDLTLIYPDGTEALRGIDLCLGRGIFGLLGPNGAGKSSLMRLLATLQRPSRGSMRFDDIDLLAEPERLRQRLGYLPQDFGVYPNTSALDLLDHLAVLTCMRSSASTPIRVTIAWSNQALGPLPSSVCCRRAALATI